MFREPPRKQYLIFKESDYEDLSDVMDKVEKAFVDKDWFGAIATAEDRKVLVIVIDPDDVYKIHELKASIPKATQKLLDHHQMKVFFMKVAAIDPQKGEVTFLDNKTINEYQEDCDCEVCQSKKN
ncbi:MAG TPA: hypothetical protein VMX17_04740 [Candidatus Glassbacteria bacterium]|nr:hypothetical protein [Candidatus Glassbacteria bacterium]